MWDEPTTRAACQGRSMGVCEYCRERRATEMHHRMSRGVGGKWHPANIIHLCSTCHLFATLEPIEAHGVGLVVWSTEVPADQPVHTPLGVLWLTDEVTGEREEPARKRPRTTRAHRVGRGRKLR